MPQLPAPIRSLLMGGLVAALGTLILFAFKDAFYNGATWSPVTQRGGPGFVFVIGPALIGWFWIASLVKPVEQSAVWRALGMSALPAAVVVLFGFYLGRIWPNAPMVLESLFSTMAVALMVGTLASVSVRLALEPNRE